MSLSPAVARALPRGTRGRIASACYCSISHAPSGSRLTDRSARLHRFRVLHSFHCSPSALTSLPIPQPPAQKQETQEEVGGKNLRVVLVWASGGRRQGDTSEHSSGEILVSDTKG